MITSPAFRGKRYAVLGLARSGLATVDALVASGAEVTAWDSNEEARAKVQGKRRREPRTAKAEECESFAGEGGDGRHRLTAA